VNSDCAVDVGSAASCVRLGWRGVRLSLYVGVARAQALGEQNPQLMQLINANQAEFLRMLNEPAAPGDAAGLAAQLGAAAATAGAGGGDGGGTLWRRVSAEDASVSSVCWRSSVSP
jgi:XPC-binding domain